MATKIACVHCGFIFEDEDMEVCPVCGTELGQEWNPAELQSFVVTELSAQQAEVVGKLVHKSAAEVSKELAADGCFGLNDLTPVQVETWGNQLKATGIEFTVENSEQKALRIQKTLDARTAEAEASKAASAASTEKARLEAEQKKAALDAEAEIKKAQAEAKAKEADAKKAEQLAAAKQAAALEAEKLAAAKASDAEKAAQLAAAKNADAATEKARLAAEAEVKKVEAEAKAQAEAARLAEEERLKREAKAVADAKAAEEAAALAQQQAAAEAAAEAERNREIVCHSCGKSYKHTKKFCPECGAPNKELNPDKWICTKCGKEYSEPAKFCEECGGKIEIVTVENPALSANQPEVAAEPVPEPSAPVVEEVVFPKQDSADITWPNELTIKKQNGLWVISANDTAYAYFDSTALTVYSDSSRTTKICYAAKRNSVFQFFDGTTNQALGTFEKGVLANKYTTADGREGKFSFEIGKTLTKNLGIGAGVALAGVGVALLGGAKVKTLRIDGLAAFGWTEKRILAFYSYNLIIFDQSLIRPAVAAMIVLL